ncbi:hypothetical protein FBU59_004421 [Linderina macrospora]|uniref:Uncharacterized protein n=1 Tax=Linderina macrospora TaxID=4868 RepID=A0ACC1J5Q8_9FUNG|nr:hypothetical protein FBU59_004421 [Linderina macrospora]
MASHQLPKSEIASSSQSFCEDALMTVSSSSSSTTLADSPPTLRLATPSSLPADMQLPEIEVNLPAPALLSPHSPMLISETPTKAATFTVDSSMLSTFSAFDALGTVSVCQMPGELSGTIDENMLAECYTVTQQQCSPPPAFSSICKPGKPAQMAAETSRPRTLNRTAKSRSIQRRRSYGDRPKRYNKMVIPAINQDGSEKRCSNCSVAETPSWRRHPGSNKMLCNACGLYLRLHNKPRPVSVDEHGHMQVIRKNAAVKRDPVNLARSDTISTACPMLFRALALAPANKNVLIDEETVLALASANTDEFTDQEAALAAAIRRVSQDLGDDC